jgi:hypothetical protein
MLRNRRRAMPQSTWEFVIQLPNGGGTIKDTASAGSEYDAMRIIKARYPGAIVFAGSLVR